MSSACRRSGRSSADCGGGWRSRLKPVTPLRGSNRPKQAHSHPQRRRRFHQRPTNTTGSPTTRPNTARHETHDTNARRPTLALETHDTNARLQPPKTGPFTPAKATQVSRTASTTPAKATPVSPTADKHNRRHRPQPPDSHQRDLSTGEILNASYPQGHNSSFSSHSRREIIHQSGPYPQLHMVVSNCYLNSSHPSDRRFALLAFMERKCSCIASERTATF